MSYDLFCHEYLQKFIDDCKLIKEAITLVDNKDNLDTARAKIVLAKVKTRLASILNFVKKTSDSSH